MGIVEIIGLMSDIITIFWTLLIVVGIFGALGAKVFYEYFAKPGNEPEENTNNESKDSDCEFEVSEESRIVTDLGDIVCLINLSRLDIRKLNDCELCHALEDLSSAAEHTLCAMRSVLDYQLSLDEDKQQ